MSNVGKEAIGVRRAMWWDFDDIESKGKLSWDDNADNEN